MQDTIAIDRLSLDHFRQHGQVPKVTPELTRRIQGHGCIDPVIVRPSTAERGRFDIISNAETYLAAGRLGLSRVPVVIRDDLDDKEACDIVREHHSAGSNPIDEAEWLKDQLDEQASIHGGRPSIARLARLMGKNRSQISRALALLTLTPEVQDHFRAGRLSAAHGRILVNIKDSLEQKRLARKAVKENLSVRDLQAAADEPPDTADESQVSPEKKDPDTLRLERDLTALVGCPVSIDHQKGLLSIRYFGDFETLEGILCRLGHRAN